MWTRLVWAELYIRQFLGAKPPIQFRHRRMLPLVTVTLTRYPPTLQVLDDLYTPYVYDQALHQVMH